MVGELITLPLRVGVRATQLWLRAAEQTISVFVETTGRLIGGGASDDGQPWRPEPRYEAVEQPLAPMPAETPAYEPPPPAPTPPEPAPEPEPVHVSEEPELVEEVADPGAQNGAGASVHVEPPWEGYDRMKATEVVDRVTSASAAELAAIHLYETGTKGRKTVLEAVERELQASTGGRSHS
jgi:hypothetical protein